MEGTQVTAAIFNNDGAYYTKKPIPIKAVQIPFTFWVASLEGNHQGKVAIRGQYIREVIKTEQDLIIYHAHGSMRIPNHKLYEMLVAKSEHRVSDKYRKQKPDFLYYFNWQPDVEQGVLVPV